MLNSDATPGEDGSLLSTVCYESVPNEERASTVLFYALFYTFTQEEIIGCIFNVLSRELEDRRLSLKLIEKFGPCVLQSLSLSRYIKPWWTNVYIFYDSYALLTPKREWDYILVH